MKYLMILFLFTVAPSIYLPCSAKNSPVVTPVNEAIGCNDTLGISLRPEYTVYPTKTTNLRFILYNNSGDKITCGKYYNITYKDEKGIWRDLPNKNVFQDIQYVVRDGQNHYINAFIDPEAHPNRPERYRFFFIIDIDGYSLTLMEEFRLTNDKRQLEQAVRSTPFIKSPRLTNRVTTTNTNEKQDTVFNIVDEMPQFPGGMSQLSKFIKDNMRYPPVAAREDVPQGRVIVLVVINKDGSITNCRVGRSVHPYLDKEAIRIVKKMPKWKPGKQNGKPERVKYAIPVTFRFADK